MSLANNHSGACKDTLSACRVTDTQSRQPKKYIYVSLLSDELGRVVVLHSSDALIIPQQVQAQTGRALTPANMQRWLAELKMDFPPALASCHKFETLIDRHLLEQPDSQWLQIENTRWGKLADIDELVAQPQVTVAPVCEPAPSASVSWDAPFEPEEEAINAAVKQFTARRIRQRIDETLELPPLPQSAQQIIKLRNDPDADAEKLASIIEEDSSLAAQIVGWASNSYFSAPGQIRSVQDAIVRVLGYDLVMNLAMGLALGKLLEVPKHRGASLPFWQQSMVLAGLNTGITDLIPTAYRPTYGLAYLSGLLHNFGYLVLHHSFRPQFDAIEKLLRFNLHLEPSQVEMHVLGITREQIAVALLRTWRLPEEVIHAIKYLHQEDYAGAYSDYAQINRLALTLARQQGYCAGPVRSLPEASLERLHLSDADLSTLMTKFSGDLDNLIMMAGALGKAN